jgi:hypothetical protein
MPTPAGWKDENQYFTTEQCPDTVTYSPSCKHISRHKSLSFGHGLQEAWNAEDQVIRGGALTELSVDMSLHAQNLV